MICADDWEGNVYGPEGEPAPSDDVIDDMVDQSRNGVKVVVHRSADGSVVEADCQCFGLPGRVHSSSSCPVLKGITRGS